MNETMKNYKKYLSITLAVLFAFAISSFTPAGKVYVTHTGHIWFFSTTPMEDIEAHNYQAGANLNPSTGDMAFSVLIKSFQFKKQSMQEHFNENYMESDKYPKSTFKGKITDLSKVNFDKDGEYKVTVAGDLNMHNVTKNISAPGTITVKGDLITAKSTFKVTLKDYNIAVPSVVRNKIAETLDVHVDVAYPKK
jgi:hypothetical protein